jgi:hypothetical protein
VNVFQGEGFGNEIFLHLKFVITCLPCKTGFDLVMGPLVMGLDLVCEDFNYLVNPSQSGGGK